MKVFISYANKDKFLAKKITAALIENGLDVWNAETEIMPGDNWAGKISAALEESDAMVVLITPESMESMAVRKEIEYALGEKSYNKRLIPVLVGSEQKISTESIPWILRRLQMIRLPKPDETEEGIFQITQALREVA